MAISDLGINAPDVSRISRCVAGAQALYARYRAYRKQRRRIAELRAVDPRILRDMAIDRSEVTSIVRTGGTGRRRKM